MTKTVLISGANKGIGYETAKQLGAKGWFVLVGARNEDRGQTAVQHLQEQGIRAEWIKLDLNDLATIHQAAEFIQQNHPDLQAVINNAGIPGDMNKCPLDFTVEELQAVTSVNFLGNFEMIKAFTPILAKNYGRIVNLTVPSLPSGYFHPFAYLTSKSTLNMMIKLVGRDYKQTHTNVDIMGIAPGGITTDLNGHMKNPLMRTVKQGAHSVVQVVTDKRHHQGKIVLRFGIGNLLTNMLFKKN